jgi:hypothetical protein
MSKKQLTKKQILRKASSDTGVDSPQTYMIVADNSKFLIEIKTLNKIREDRNLSFVNGSIYQKQDGYLQSILTNLKINLFNSFEWKVDEVLFLLTKQ